MKEISQEEIRALCALQKIPKIGPIKSKSILDEFGSAVSFFQNFNENKNIFSEIKSVQIKSLFEQVDTEIEYCLKNNIAIIGLGSKEYPHFLTQCPDASLVLFVKGKIDFKKIFISIVGTRNPTNSGLEFCNQIIEALTPYNPIITSGFAYGIDIQAHKHALKKGLETVAVLAHGFNKLYPSTHIKYVESILKQGGFITDFFSDTPIFRGNFIRRNRIVAGLSKATIVIESAKKGGSLITAELANSYSRDVLAVPGRPTDKMSEGCNNLIKLNKAFLITNPQDVIDILNFEKESSSSLFDSTLIEVNKKSHKWLNLSKEEQKIIDLFDFKKNQNVDELSLNLNISISSLGAILFDLELKGLIKNLGGGIYSLNT